jgi:hypothetical protein
MNRVDSILSDLRDLHQRVNDLLVELDQDRIYLTPEEQARIDESHTQARILERVKPFLLLSQMIENMEESGETVDSQIEASGLPLDQSF